MNSIFKTQIQTALGSIQHEFELATHPITLAEFASELFSFEDKLVQIAAKAAIADGVNSISCKPQCGACCSQAVPISIPEAFLIYDLVQSLTSEKKAQVLRRFDAISQRLKAENIEADQRADESSDDRWSRLLERYFYLGMPCPFLENQSCSIYENRPSICREFLVTTPAKACSQPDIEEVRGIDNVFIMSHCLARLSAILMENEPNLLPLSLCLNWVEENKAWHEKRFDPALLYSTLFDIIRDATSEAESGS